MTSIGNNPLANAFATALGQAMGQAMQLQHFGAGEKVLRQGEVSAALYIIISGQAKFSAIDPQGQEREVLTLKLIDIYQL